MTEPDSRRCKATRTDGQPCRAWASRSTGLCPLHSENSLQLHVLGGLSKTREHMLETRMNPRFKPVIDMLAGAITETHAGKLQPSAAQGMAALASALIRVTEFAELMKRVEQLEDRMRSERG